MYRFDNCRSLRFPTRINILYFFRADHVYVLTFGQKYVNSGEFVNEFFNAVNLRVNEAERRR